MFVPKVDFSIAICTYNPKPKLFDRLLSAISAILAEMAETEVLIIDNNSSPAVESLASVQSFLAKNTQARCIIETHQGLTAARCRAVQEASAPIMIFFDDDNEPCQNYLHILSSYFSNYPNVGVWGPGQITVEYVDPVAPWLQNHCQSFQQRQLDFGYGCIPASWGLYYPTGTGFAVRREILEKYVSEVEQGILRASGRKGKSLSSGEDVQIVWEAIKLGFAAGVIPELCCNHLISSGKANLNYLKRLHFGTASSYMPALKESFPAYTSKMDVRISIVKIYKELAKLLLGMVISPQKRFDLELKIADKIGSLYGESQIVESPYSNHILFLAKQFNLI